MIEIFRAQHVVGTIPRPDRIGGSVAIYAVLHAHYDPELGFLGFRAYWGADDGCAYPGLPEERSSFEATASRETASKRAAAAWTAWMLEVDGAVHALNCRVARGEVALPGDEFASDDWAGCRDDQAERPYLARANGEDGPASARRVWRVA